MADRHTTRAPRPAALLLALLAACGTASPSPSAAPSATPDTTPTPSAPASAPQSPTPTPEPALSLDLPPEQDARQVSVSVAPQVPPDGDGRLQVTVTSHAAVTVDELVLRWDTALDQTLFLAPFAPSQQRIANGGPPLVQNWTKWVIGPGERGEPAGTTSLGWGPLLPNATLEIPVLVNRRAPGPVSFDLQVLAGEAILTLQDGEPAELRIDVP